MAERIKIEAARIPDRDRLLETLSSNGQDARPIAELGIEVHCDDQSGADVYGYVENTVMALGSPYVPQKHEGVIYLRPPIG